MVIWKYDCASWRTIHFFFNWKLVSWHSIQRTNPRRKWRLFPSFSQLNSETVDCSVTFSLKLRYFAWLIHFFDRIFLFTWLSAVCRANRVAERFCIRELFHIFWMLSRGPSALNSLACILNIRFFYHAAVRGLSLRHEYVSHSLLEFLRVARTACHAWLLVISCLSHLLHTPWLGIVMFAW